MFGSSIAGVGGRDRRAVALSRFFVRLKRPFLRPGLTITGRGAWPRSRMAAGHRALRAARSVLYRGHAPRYARPGRARCRPQDASGQTTRRRLYPLQTAKRQSERVGMLSQIDRGCFSTGHATRYLPRYERRLDRTVPRACADPPTTQVLIGSSAVKAHHSAPRVNVRRS